MTLLISDDAWLILMVAAYTDFSALGPRDLQR